MTTTHHDPTPSTGSGRTHVRHTHACYRIPPTIRITGWMVASALKRAIVAGANVGIVPPRVAEALIRLGGLRHV